MKKLFGEAVKPTKDKSCLNCSKYLRCYDPSKSFNYRCSLYSSILEGITDESMPKPKKKKLKREVVETEDNGTDFSKIIDNVIADEKNSPLPRDLRIDDGDFPRSKNFFEFVTEPNFLGMDMTPFAKQLEIGTRFMAEWCPRCSDPDYIFNVPMKHRPKHFLEKVQLLNWGKCPRCKATKSELYLSRELDVPYTLVGLGGQRMSKSTLTAMLINYHTHAYLKLQQPTKVFGVLGSTDLHGMFTALTWQKAKNLLWDPIYNFLSISPWFKGFHAMLDHYGEKYGEELYKLKDTFYRNRVRNLFMYPEGPSRTKMRGVTLFQAGIDEIGLMDSDNGDMGGKQKDRMNSDEVFNTLRNQSQTVRLAYYKLLKQGSYDMLLPPMISAISSPMSKRDKIVRLYEESKTNRHMYGFHYASWEANPNISKRELLEEYNGDLPRVMRDFGAVPPNSSLPYIADLSEAYPIVDKNRINAFAITPILRDSKSGQKHRSGRVTPRIPKDGIKRIMALDAGMVNNHFSMCAGFWDTELKRPVIDCILELMPTRDNPINFNFVYEDIIRPIIDHANVQFIVADRWNSRKILDDAVEDHQLQGGESYSVKQADFATFKEDMGDGRFTIPKAELVRDKIEAVGEKEYPKGFADKPISHFLYQLITVQDTGKDVIKGDGTEDDILRAMVLLYSYLSDVQYREYCSGSVHVTSKWGFAGVVGSRGIAGGMGSGASSSKFGVVTGLSAAGIGLNNRR